MRSLRQSPPGQLPTKPSTAHITNTPVSPSLLPSPSPTVPSIDRVRPAGPSQAVCDVSAPPARADWRPASRSLPQTEPLRASPGPIPPAPSRLCFAPSSRQQPSYSPTQDKSPPSSLPSLSLPRSLPTPTLLPPGASIATHLLRSCLCSRSRDSRSLSPAQVPLRTPSSLNSHRQHTISTAQHAPYHLDPCRASYPSIDSTALRCPSSAFSDAHVLQQCKSPPR